MYKCFVVADCIKDKTTQALEFSESPVRVLELSTGLSTMSPLPIFSLGMRGRLYTGYRPPEKSIIVHRSQDPDQWYTMLNFTLLSPFLFKHESYGRAMQSMKKCNYYILP